MKTTYIYLLTDPRTLRPFYVGMTDYPRDRLNGHVGNCRIKGRKRNATQDYIKEMVEDGYRPNMTVIDSIETESMADVFALEHSWMSKMIELGHELTNTRREKLVSRVKRKGYVKRGKNGEISIVLLDN